MLVASWSHARGEAGTGSGITLGPGVLLRRSSGDIFVRAMVPLGILLSELGEFCSTSPKTLSLLLKHRGLGVLPLASLSSPNATAGAVLVGEREPPSPPFPPAGKKWPSSIPGRAATKMEKASVLPEEDATLPWFSQPLVDWHGPLCHVLQGVGRTPRQQPPHTGLGAGCSGGCESLEGAACKSTLSRLKWFHGVCVESSPPAFPAPNCEK